jgi:hypothetical protein
MKLDLIHKATNFKKIGYEPLFFLLIALLNLIPVVAFTFFPTLDGPAHLYNSNLIAHLLSDTTSPLKPFFTFTPELLPNWTGHAVLSFFNFFLPAYWAEKILLVLYLIGLPYAFRYLVSVINPKALLVSYIIFPFTYSFFLFLGFYNFLIALVFMFLGLALWIKKESNRFTVLQRIILLMVFLLTYFSHIFVFGILFLFVFIHVIFKNILRLNTTENESVKFFFRNVVDLISISFLPLLLLVLYFYQRPVTNNLNFLTTQELTQYLTDLRPIIALNYPLEEYYTRRILYVLLAISCVILGYRILDVRNVFIDRSTQKNNVLAYFKPQDYWVIPIIILFIALFKLPDSDGTAGYVSVRLALLFFLFLLLWLATQNSSKYVMYPALVIILYAHFQLNKYYYSEIKNLNTIALDCYNASEVIAPNSIVLPLNYTDNWLLSHFSNYLGTDNPLVILENYECTTGYFPLKWNDEKIPNLVLADKTKDYLPCFDWRTNMNNPTDTIDYVFIIGESLHLEGCRKSLDSLIHTQFTQVYQSQHARLYKGRHVG